MKKIIYISVTLSVAALLFVLPACHKNNDYPSKVVLISYPTVTLNGPADTTINRGATWVDPGATWVDSVTGETGTIKFTVNANVDSAYLFTYVATNKNGFISTNNPANNAAVTRGLAVTNISANATIAQGGSATYTVNNGYFPPDPQVAVAYVSRGLFTVSDIDGFGDPGVVAIKSDSTISVAQIVPAIVNPYSYFGTYISSANIPETFTQSSVIYQAAYIYTGVPPRQTAQSPVIISYTETPLNGPGFGVTLSHN